MIGLRGYWIEDNDYCEIVGVVDEGVGLYEFKSLDPEPHYCEYPDCAATDAENWIGFIEDFSVEV